MTIAFRERALRWLVRACVAVCLAGVGGAESAKAQEPLKLWHAYGGAEEDAIRQAARAFEQAHGIEVEILANAFGAYGSKLESAIPTGQGPDVFIDAHERLASYLERSLIAPIEGSDVSSFSAEDLSALTDGGALNARFRASTGVVDQHSRTVTVLFDIDPGAVAVGQVVRLAMATPIDAAGFWVPTSALAEGRPGLGPV